MFEDRTALPHVTVVADLHCATGPTSSDHETYGIPTPTVLDLMPPAREVTHDNGEPLTAEHGFPLRLVEPHLLGCKSPKWLRAIEYLAEDRRSYREERGHHNGGVPWKERRYSHQDQEGGSPWL